MSTFLQIEELVERGLLRPGMAETASHWRRMMWKLGWGTETDTTVFRTDLILLRWEVVTVTPGSPCSLNL